MNTAGTSPDAVIRTLTQTALHTLNVYGDNDPAGEYILQGLNRLAEMTVRLCGPDTAARDAYRSTVEKARGSASCAGTQPVTTQEMLKAHTRLRELLERPDAGEEGMENMRDAVDYLRDFWETVNTAG